MTFFYMYSYIFWRYIVIGIILFLNMSYNYEEEEDDQENHIQLSINVIKDMNSFEDNKCWPVNYTMQLISAKMTNTGNQADVKVYSAVFADRNETSKNFLLYIKQGVNPVAGDIYHIKSFKPVLLKDKSKIYLINQNNFKVIGHRDLPKQNDNVQTSVIKQKEEEKQKIGWNVQETQRSNSKIDLGNVQLLSHLTTFSKEIQLYVKITKKSEIKHFQNKSSNQPGQLFSFTMNDVEGFEMQATVFGATVDKLFALIKNDCYYLIKGGYIKINDKRYSSVRADYRLIIDDRTQIEEMKQERSFKEAQVNIVTIEDLPKLALSTSVDCLLYVIEGEEKKMITTRRGDEMSLRKLTVGDLSGYKCELTLWRSHSEMEIKADQIILARYVRISEFNGRNLGTIDDTIITIEPSTPDTKKLRELISKDMKWNQLENSGVSDSVNPVETSYIKDMTENISQIMDEKVPLLKIKATICTFKHSDKNYYLGCPEKSCKKKLLNEANGWTCVNCQKIIEKPYCYYTMNMRIKDASSEFWIDLFGDVCSKLLGIPSDQYKDMIDNNDITKLNELTSRLEFQTKIFIGKGKLNFYNGIEKKRFNVYKIEDFNPVQESKKTLNYLKSLGLK